MDEMIKNALFSSVVYPMLVAGILGVILSKMILRIPNGRDWAGGLALSLAFLTCFYTTVPWQGFPPIQVFGWIGLISGLGLCLFTLTATAHPGWRLAATLLVVSMAAYAFLGPVSRDWASSSRILVFAAILILWSLWWWFQPQTLAREDHGTLLLHLVAIATATALVSTIGGSAKLGQVSGGLAAACGALFLVRLFSSQLEVGVMTIAVFCATLGTCLLNALFYVKVPLWVILSILLTSQTHWLLRAPWVQSLKPWKRSVLICSITVLALAGTITAMVLTLPKDEYAY